MRLWKIGLLILAGLLVISLLVIGSLPSVLSTQTGTRWLLHVINSRITGELSVETLHLSWFGHQSFTHLTLKDKEATPIISVDSFDSKTPLITLLFPGSCLGQTTINHPYLYLKKEAGALSNLEMALSAKEEKKEKTKAASKKRGFPFLCFLGPMQLENGELTLVSGHLDPVVISQLHIDYDKQKDIFHLKAETRQGTKKGEILASGNLTHRLHILAQITNLPIAMFDQMTEHPIFVPLLGDSLDCKIETTQDEGKLSINATLTSSQLNGVINTKVIDNQLVIQSNSHLNYLFTPAAFQSLLGSEQQKQWRLATKVPVTLSFQEGYIPLSYKKWDETHTLLKAVVICDRAELVHTSLGPFTLSEMQSRLVLHEGTKIQFSGKFLGKTEGMFSADMTKDVSGGMTFQLHSQNFPFALLDLVMDETETLQGLLGQNISLDISGSSNKKQTQATIDISSQAITINGLVEGSEWASLNFYVKGQKEQVSEKWKQVLGPHLTFEMKGKAGIWDKNFGITTLAGQISSDMVTVDVRGKLGEKQHPFSCEQIQLSANGTILQLPYGEKFEDATLKKGQFILTLDGKENLMKGTAKIQVAVTQEGNKIESKDSEIEVHIKDLMCGQSFDLKKAIISVKGNLQHFPAILGNLLTPGDFNLEMITGPVIDAKIQGVYDPHDPEHLATIDLKAASPGFKANIKVSIDGTLTINQPEPATIVLDVTPDRYRQIVALLGPERLPDYSLTKQMRLELSLSEFKCPAKKPESLSSLICQSGIVGSITATPILYMKGAHTLAIRDLQILLHAENISESLFIDLSAQFSGSASIANDPSLLKLTAHVENLWDEAHTLTPEALTISGEVNGHLLPIRQLLGIAPLKEQTRSTWRAILGDYLNTHISGKVTGGEGPVIVDLKASNFKALLPLKLTPKEILLSDHVVAEITLTDEVSNVLLVDVNPLFITGARSEHPLKLYISPEGFSFPINPFFFKGINVNKAILDMGKIQIRNGGHIQSLMEFLKASEISEDNWMQAWFTPIFISLHDGTSSYERFDILLANMVHIALWGKIDLVKNKVRMTLGIAPNTLAQRFSITGLSKKDMFQVKMRGKTNDVELDWSSAYTRIGIIVARLAGGHLAYLIGGVLDQLITLFGDEATPPPTTVPFPWEEPQQNAEGIPEISPPEKIALSTRAFKGIINFLLP